MFLFIGALAIMVQLTALPEPADISAKKHLCGSVVSLLYLASFGTLFRVLSLLVLVVSFGCQVQICSDWLLEPQSNSDNVKGRVDLLSSSEHCWRLQSDFALKSCNGVNTAKVIQRSFQGHQLVKTKETKIFSKLFPLRYSVLRRLGTFVCSTLNTIVYRFILNLHGVPIMM